MPTHTCTHLCSHRNVSSVVLLVSNVAHVKPAVRDVMDHIGAFPHRLIWRRACAGRGGRVGTVQGGFLGEE